MLRRLPPMYYVGRVNCSTGYGQAARHQIWVLRQFHGLRLKIVDAGSVGDPDPERTSEFVQSARLDSPGIERAVGTIIHLAPNCAISWLHRTPAPHVLVSVWETTRLPEGWAEMCNQFDQVWCATHWQYGVYLESGVDQHRLRVVPFAVDPALFAEPGPAMGPPTWGLKPETKLFGSMFQWTARKAPETLIGGFIQAFDGHDDVALVIKSYTGDHLNTSIEEDVNRIAKRFRPVYSTPRIITISEQWSSDQVLAFYRGLDCYVQPHRGEGFGLPIVEALLTGCPAVVATNWSAPAEYGDGLIIPVDYTLEAPHSMDWQPFYTIDQRWAAPNTESLYEKLRYVYAGAYSFQHSKAAFKFTSLMEQAGVNAREALEEL